MGLWPPILYSYLVGGRTPPKAASLTGDMSQMEKALVARILQSTSPGLTGNDAGSLGEQTQRLIDLWAKSVSSGLPAGSASGSPLQRLLALSEQLLGTTASGVAANQAGSLAGMIKYLASNYPRNPYVPNFHDSWGFHGFQYVVSAGAAGTDPAIVGPGNLRWHGYLQSGTGTGQQIAAAANPIAGRGSTLQMTSGSTASGNYQQLLGIAGMEGSTRITIPGIPNYPSAYYTNGQIVLEANLVPDSIASVDHFIGLSSGVDPFAAATYAVGACYSAAIDGNWRALNNNNGTVSTDKTAGTVAASTAAVRNVRVVITATSVTVTVDGTVVASAYATNFPTSLSVLSPRVLVITRTTANKSLYVERHHDWVQ